MGKEVVILELRKENVVASGMKGGGEASHSKLGMIKEGLLESMEENIYDKNLEITL